MKRIYFEKFLHGNFQCIDSEAEMSWIFIAFYKRSIFILKHVLHAAEESFWELFDHSCLLFRRMRGFGLIIA